MSQPKFTIIHPYYEGGEAVAVHFDNWRAYPSNIRENLQFIIVDDGSPTQPLEKFIPENHGLNFSAFRIEVDIPWNDGGARNLGAHHAQADWMIMLDLDKRITKEEMRKLWEIPLKTSKYYKFLHPTSPKGTYANQTIVHRETYMRLGGYNEDHSGGRGGSGSFFRTLRESGLDEKILPVQLRHVSPGKVRVLDRTKVSLEEKAKNAGRPLRQPHEPATMLRFPWKQIR